MRPVNPILLILFVFLISSCEENKFSDPQPHGIKNKYKFPKSLRGQWISPTDSVLVSKTQFHLVEFEWIDLMHKDSIQYENEIFIEDNKLYDLSEESKKGYNYKIERDSIFVYLPNKKAIHLGDSAFLRKLNKYQFVVNVAATYPSKKGSIHPDSTNTDPVENNMDLIQYWKIYLIEIGDDKSISIRYSHTDEEDILRELKEINTIEIQGKEEDGQKSERILDVRLSVDEFEQFIDKGGFSKTHLELLDSNRIQ